MKRHILTQPQIDFVRFLGNRDISDKEINDIKTLISQYYLIKADLLMDGLWEENKLSEKKMMEILNTVL